jgi:hypothetical protein
LAARILTLFRTDVVLTRLGAGAYSRCPRPQGRSVGYELTFHVPRTIAVEAVLKATKLPGFWPPAENYSSVLERSDWHLYDEDDGADPSIVGPLRELCRSHDQRQIVLSSESVDRALSSAQGLLVGKFNQTCASLRELRGLQAHVSEADRVARYPDGARIFDLEMLPTFTLPIDDLARAAE